MAELTKVSMAYSKKDEAEGSRTATKQTGTPESSKTRTPTERMTSLFSKILKKKK